MPTVTEEDEKEPSQLNKGEPPLTSMSDDVHVVDLQAMVRLAMDNRAALSSLLCSGGRASSISGGPTAVS